MESQSEFIADYNEEVDVQKVVTKQARLACSTINFKFNGNSMQLDAHWHSSQVKRI